MKVFKSSMGFSCVAVDADEGAVAETLDVGGALDVEDASALDGELEESHAHSSAPEISIMPV
ncbi:hypothetical protein [Rhodanobacter sp. DHB23]|uniref:hypothetical protein n=1 Tax=Rhodanobacter sp. DHB23 TaxID=2775923 RepID=UPI00177B17C2|nr:hypothetical protein [Rhodanobacter sp. DHB23]MBD8873463.1 hypothetical protein [Rhodanobacter sp. DHB23]